MPPRTRDGILTKTKSNPRTIILVSARGLVKGAYLGVSPLFCGVVWCGIKLVRESGNRLPSVVLQWFDVICNYVVI